MSSQRPIVNGRLKSALEAIDRTRLKFDQAIKDGDEKAAANLLQAITELAHSLDNLSEPDGDTSALVDKAET